MTAKASYSLGFCVLVREGEGPIGGPLMAKRAKGP